MVSVVNVDLADAPIPSATIKSEHSDMLTGTYPEAASHCGWERCQRG